MADRIRFLLDEHVPNAVARALRRRGIDVQTANEAGLRGLPDVDYLAHGSSSGRVVVTNDPDFLQHHRTPTEHAGIAYCGQRSRTIGPIIEGLVLIFEVLEPRDMVGRVEYL